MKIILKRIIPFILSVEILVVSFFTCSVSVYAADFMPHDIIEAVEYGIEYNDWDPFWRFLNDSKDGLMYLYSQMGAFVTQNFQAWVDNNKALESLAETVPTPAKKEGENIVFTKDFMAQLKELLDEYAAENQPFELWSTYRMADVPASQFQNKAAYDTFKDYVSSHSITSAFVQYNYLRLADVTSLIKDGGGFIVKEQFKEVYKRAYILNGDWQVENTYYDEYRTDGIFIELYKEKAGRFYKHQFRTATDDYKIGHTNSEIWGYIVTQDGGRIRVFKTQADFMNYSVGQRKIYYTSNYYDYVPEDLTVSIDELQKTIEDMQDIIDKLLDQITNNTSESEIEELLKQILDELRKNPGTGGDGSGSGGGDINVDIDLSTTNSWLSKIYTKVSQIFDTLSGGSVLQEGFDAVLAGLEDLNAMLKKYLSEITGDLDDIKGQLANMSEQEFNEKSDSFLGDVMDAFSEISEVVKTKFPFSIPNDLRIFLSKIAPAPPETEAALYMNDINDTSGITLYSEHGGSGTSDGEPNPSGGGGASRPGSGFVDVDHGGGGGSREPVEIKNSAPVFRLPIVIERYGIEEYIIIDMAPFDPLSRFSRSFFTVIFMVCLFNLTFKVIGMWGDLIG